MAAIPLRADYDGQQLRLIAKRVKDGPQARRLLALAVIYDGVSRSEAARIGGVTLQVIRDWVLRFNARGPDGLMNGKAPGQPSRLTAAHRAALAAIVESGPIPASMASCAGASSTFASGCSRSTGSRCPSRR